MTPLIEQICKKYGIAPEAFYGSDPRFAKPRAEAIQTLAAKGVGAKEIAYLVGCHVQTVFYWKNPARRTQMIANRKQYFEAGRLPGPRQTKKSREEILAAYLENPAKGTALAVSRGLAPLYAYKLANAMGVVR